MSSEKQVNLSIEEFKLILDALDYKYDMFCKVGRIIRDDVLKAENSNHPVFKQILEESSKIPLLCSKLRDAMYKTKKRRN
jgi:hypothetical protein